MVPFVIAGYDSRSISFLANLLRPCITVYEELFNRHDSEMMERLDRQNALIQVGQDPIEFLQKQIYNQSCGFSLPYYHARCASWCRVWSFIQKNIKIVLVQDNPIHSLAPEKGTIYLEANTIQRTIQKNDSIQEDLKKFFRDSEIIYVDLDNFKNWYEILSFLDLPIVLEPLIDRPKLDWLETI